MSDNLNDKELEAVNNCGEHCCSHLRPLIKTEYNYLSDDDLDPHITTKHIPYTATELAKLKKEYGRLPYESETEYVFRVSLTGGDQIKLTEQEASGYWGHGVFLTTGDKRDSWSLTQHAAFWAGGTNPLERGDPIAIISTPDQLLESVHKAACLQMIHEKKLIPGFESPMQLPVKPELMTPLIRGLPETLKPTAIALQKTIMTLSPTEKLDRFLGNPTNRTGSTDPSFTPSCSPFQAVNSQASSPGSNYKIWTWGEVAEDLINYCRKYGPVKTPEEKPEKSEKTKEIRSIGTPYSKNPEKGKQNPNRQHWWSLGVQKGVPREVMDGLPLDKLQKIITNWCYRKSNPSVQPSTHPSAPTLPHNMGSEPTLPQPLLPLPNMGKETTFSLSLLQNRGSGQKLTISQLSSQNSGCDPKLTFSQFLSQNPGSESSLSQPFPQNLSRDSCGFRDAEKRYATWEKGLFVVSLALIEVERLALQLPIVLRSPFNDIKTVTTGTLPPDGVAQRASVRKWYAQTEHYCHFFSITDGVVKNLAIQETESLDSSQDTPASVIKMAPPFSPKQSASSWFTELINTEGESSARVGEPIAVWSAFQRVCCVYFYRRTPRDMKTT
ncbi:uncharacterized protein LOC144248855 [Lonchura striata]